MRVVHYVNQFFAGLGGEEKAGIPLEAREGPVGPGKLLEQLMGNGAQVVATLICGDNYAAEGLERLTAAVVEKVREVQGDLFVAGPCFGAGRYGVASGALCAAVQAQLQIPAVTGMTAENPGVDLYSRDAYIVDSGQNVAEMRQVMSRMVSLASKLARKEPVGRSHEEGYFPRGVLRSEFVPKMAAQRLVDMLLARTTGQPFTSELAVDPAPSYDPAPSVSHLSESTIALVTDGGLVPKGNPDNIPTSFARVWGAYDIGDRDDLEGEEFEVTHGGYDNRSVQLDPDRLVPVDVLRELEREGVIGRLHHRFLATTGNGNTLENTRRIGREMAATLNEEGVNAVILTST